MGLEVRRYSERQVQVKVFKRLMGKALLTHEVLHDLAVMGPDAIAQVIKQLPHRQGLFWRPVGIHFERQSACG